LQQNPSLAAWERLHGSFAEEGTFNFTHVEPPVQDSKTIQRAEIDLRGLFGVDASSNLHVMNHHNDNIPPSSNPTGKIDTAVRTALVPLGYILLYVLLDWLTKTFQIFPGVVAWYPPAGLSFAFLLVFGMRFMPVVGLASLISSYFIYRFQQPPAALIGWAFLVSGLYGMAAALLRQRIHIDLQLRRLRDVIWLMLSAAVISTVLAVISVSASVDSGTIPVSEIFEAVVHWWIGETIGVLTVTPFLLIHFMPRVRQFAGNPPDLSGKINRPDLSIRHVAGQAASLIATLYLAFGVPALNAFQPLYLIAVPLTWIALHGGLYAVSVGIVGVNFATTYALWAFQYDLEQIGDLQLFMLVICATGLLTGIVVSGRKLAEESASVSGQRYRSLFEDSPTSLWEEDFSAVKQRLDLLKQQGITDFRTYFAEHPQAVTECAALVRILDVNMAAVSLYKAAHKQELLKSLAEIMSTETQAHFIDELVGLTLGTTDYRWEGTDRTVRGEPIDVSITWAVAPGHEADYSRVIVSIIDIGERKRAEQEILSLSRFPSENPSPVIRLSPDGAVLFSNKASISLLRSWSQSGSLNLPDEIRSCILSALETGIEQEGEISNADQIYSFLLVPVAESGYLNMYAHDITERKQAETAQENSQAFLRALFDLSPTAILLIDPHDPDVSWRIVDCNIRACEMNGYSREELLGQSIDLFNVTPGTPAEREAQLKQLRKTRVIDHVAEHRHKDGTVFPIEYSTALFSFGGRELVIGIDRDIRDRKEAEMVLQRAKDFAEDVIQTANVLFLQLDTAGNVIKLNKAAEEITGYSRAEVEGQNWFETMVPKGRYPKVWEEFMRITQPDAATEVFENPVLTKNGQERQILWKSNVLHEGGRITGTISFGLDITGRKQTEEALRRQLDRLAALSEIDRAITSSFDMRISLSFILSQVTTLLGVDAAVVLLYNPVFTTLEYAAGRGFRTNFFERGKGLRLGEGYAGRAALDRRTINIPNLTVRTDNPRLQKTLPVEEFVSYFGVPLISKGNIRGVLEIFHRTQLTPDEEWLDFLNTLASQAALAIENATLFEGLQQSNVDLTLAYDATIEGWSRALDLRDKETEGHTQRVTEMTLKLAQVLGFSEMELVHIRRGALLHDIGKMGVADHILLKPGPLTDEEWVSMRRHPGLAYEMLFPIHYLKTALDIPYCHHERWDGTGYPRGLKGEGIPLTARIFAVVDVYDALISDRPYRPAWTQEKTLAHIQALSGAEFDPQVVDAFMRMMG
jgi:PAS domain S-box-containing protein